MNRFRLATLLLLVFPSLLVAQEAKRSYPPPAQVAQAFHKLLDRPKVLLNVKNGDAKREDGGLASERLSFASEKKADGTEERVPALIIRPEKPGKKLPAVLVLHGTGGNKEGQRALMVQLAKHDMVAIAIDARYHGERVPGSKGSVAYNQAIVAAWRNKDSGKQEHPFYFDTCWDIWRTADYLETRDDVDAKRIGIIGFSMGGIETWLAAAVDDRFKVAVPAIGVQSFRWSLENNRWQARAKTIQAAHDAAAHDLGEKEVNAKVCGVLWNKVIPGILDQYDCPSMIRLFAGRPLLILNGDRDANCPLEGANLAFASAETAFKSAGASDRLKIMVAKDTGHAVTADQRQAALAWFDKWLKQ